jgi:hypothetical protein
MMREYYFSDGVRERVYGNKRDAHSAALKHANATGRRVILKYRNLGVEPRRVATMRIRENPTSRLPSGSGVGVEEQRSWLIRGRSRSGYKTRFHVHAFDIKEAERIAKKQSPGLDIRDIVLFDDSFRRNPAIYHGSVMGHKYRALDYKEALHSLYHKAAVLKAAEPVKPASKETTIHTVELSTKAGNIIHRESFNTKQAANLWAKAARNQNFLATVY